MIRGPPASDRRALHLPAHASFALLQPGVDRPEAEGPDHFGICKSDLAAARIPQPAVMPHSSFTAADLPAATEGTAMLPTTARHRATPTPGSSRTMAQP